MALGSGVHTGPCGRTDESDFDPVPRLNEREKLQRSSRSEEYPLRPTFYMSRDTSTMRDVARLLSAYEARGNKSAGTKPAATFPVSDKLRPHLATLVGNAGYRALLARGLALASAEVPWLSGLQVKADGTLDGLEQCHAKVSAEEFINGRVVLLARLLGLLVAFIGESLTLRLVREIWPKVPLKNLDFGGGVKNGKTK